MGSRTSPDTTVPQGGGDPGSSKPKRRCVKCKGAERTKGSAACRPCTDKLAGEGKMACTKCTHDKPKEGEYTTCADCRAPTKKGTICVACNNAERSKGSAACRPCADKLAGEDKMACTKCSELKPKEGDFATCADCRGKRQRAEKLRHATCIKCKGAEATEGRAACQPCEGKLAGEGKVACTRCYDVKPKDGGYATCADCRGKRKSVYEPVDSGSPKRVCQGIQYLGARVTDGRHVAPKATGIAFGILPGDGDELDYNIPRVDKPQGPRALQGRVPRAAKREAIDDGYLLAQEHSWGERQEARAADLLEENPGAVITGVRRLQEFDEVMWSLLASPLGQLAKKCGSQPTWPPGTKNTGASADPHPCGSVNSFTEDADGLSSDLPPTFKLEPEDDVFMEPASNTFTEDADGSPRPGTLIPGRSPSVSIARPARRVEVEARRALAQETLDWYNAMSPRDPADIDRPEFPPAATAPELRQRVGARWQLGINRVMSRPDLIDEYAETCRFMSTDSEHHSNPSYFSLEWVTELSTMLRRKMLPILVDIGLGVLVPEIWQHTNVLSHGAIWGQVHLEALILVNAMFFRDLIGRALDILREQGYRVQARWDQAVDVLASLKECVFAILVTLVFVTTRDWHATKLLIDFAGISVPSDWILWHQAVRAPQGHQCRECRRYFTFDAVTCFGPRREHTLTHEIKRLSITNNYCRTPLEGIGMPGGRSLWTCMYDYYYKTTFYEPVGPLLTAVCAVCCLKDKPVRGKYRPFPTGRLPPDCYLAHTQPLSEDCIDPALQSPTASSSTSNGVGADSDDDICAPGPVMLVRGLLTRGTPSAPPCLHR